VSTDQFLNDNENSVVGMGRFKVSFNTLNTVVESAKDDS
jgi:hypothetical protein